MNNYEEKKQARIKRYLDRADKARQESSSLSDQSYRMISIIPAGQPIHGEKDRRYRERAGDVMRKSITADEKAAYYEEKAEAALCNTAISSDDPEALQKLEQKVADMKAWHATMVRCNRYYRKHGTCKGFEDMTDEVAVQYDDKIIKAHAWAKQPFPSYHLSNDSQNIKRYEQRIAQLKRTQEQGFDGWEFDGGRVVANAEINRLQVFFDEKPDAAKREKLKQNGFHFSKYNNNAWQRQLNANAVWAAKRIDFLQPPHQPD